MSSALAIAGVSAVLRDLLANAFVTQDIASITGAQVNVTAEPPDRVGQQGANDPTQLNLFLYQVTSNAAWRNSGLPSVDSSGSQRLSNPPLALNLHYLVSAYGSKELVGEVLLGHAMQVLHEVPVLGREVIHKVFNPSSPTSDPVIQALAACGLDTQIEQIKITPEFLNTEEMSKFWTATQSRLRPSATYMASVVLIQGNNRVKESLPVLQRGPADQGVSVQLGSWPVLQSIRVNLPEEANRKPEAPSWPSAQFGMRLTLQGQHLGGESVALRFEHPLMPPQEKAVPPAPPGTLISFDVPNAPTAWAAGIYTVTAAVTVNGSRRYSNALPLAFAPHISSISVSGHAGGTVTLTVGCNPELRVDATGSAGAWKLALKQKVALLVAGMELEPAPLTDSTAASAPQSIATVTFVLKTAPAFAAELATLRVDGVNSMPYVRRETPPPARLVFDDSQRITVS